jgi:DNA-binding transcriptional regulator YiaG
MIDCVNELKDMGYSPAEIAELATMTAAECRNIRMLIGRASRHGLTQEEMARAMGRHQSEVSAWENGRPIPPHVALELRLAAGLPNRLNKEK